MPKQYVKLRVGLLDHLPGFAQNPDAYLVWSWCLLSAPMSGPDAGVVRINQAHFAERWEWDRGRVNRAVKWLQSHPSLEQPLLVQVEKGARNRPGRYAIPKYETSENKGRFSSPGAHNRDGFVSDSVEQAQRIRRFVSDSVELAQRNSNKNARVRKNEDSLEQEGGFAVKHEPQNWITVDDEAEAVEALLKWRGFANLPESIQDQAIETALKNLEHYRIRYAPEQAVGE